MDSRKYMEQYKDIQQILERKLKRRERWLNVATKITPQMGGERVGGTSNSQKMENAVCEATDILEEINEDIKRLKQKESDIIQTIEKLPINLCDILYYLYIEGESLKGYAIDRKKSYSWANSLRKRALDKLQIILDEKEAVD